MFIKMLIFKIYYKLYINKYNISIVIIIVYKIKQTKKVSLFDIIFLVPILTVHSNQQVFIIHTNESILINMFDRSLNVNFKFLINFLKSCNIAVKTFFLISIIIREKLNYTNILRVIPTGKMYSSTLASSRSRLNYNICRVPLFFKFPG